MVRAGVMRARSFDMHVLRQYKSIYLNSTYAGRVGLTKMMEIQTRIKSYVAYTNITGLGLTQTCVTDI